MVALIGQEAFLSCLFLDKNVRFFFLANVFEDAEFVKEGCNDFRKSDHLYCRIINIGSL